ncbi:hypothetical protein LX32DRAFT_396239 [Colletotrichum zoysiae]|uniref:Uncharacterized protein n=1 Tax=Colletotrichum zoysiae TaxID=1216348 RepID=A0AAD9M9X0_9PEZI|nr:hypothetical protein LX32DRAFT_396239 [Colletotrichum zoysiae]
MLRVSVEVDRVLSGSDRDRCNKARESRHRRCDPACSLLAGSVQGQPRLRKSACTIQTYIAPAIRVFTKGHLRSVNSSDLCWASHFNWHMQPQLNFHYGRLEDGLSQDASTSAIEDQKPTAISSASVPWNDAYIPNKKSTNPHAFM